MQMQGKNSTKKKGYLGTPAAALIKKGKVVDPKDWGTNPELRWAGGAQGQTDLHCEDDTNK